MKVKPAMEIDLEANRKGPSTPSTQQQSSLCLILCVTVIVISLRCPFIIADLYFAYNTEPCQFIENSVGITLNTWLKVNAYFDIGIIFLAITIFATVCDQSLAKTLYSVVKVIGTLFTFAWLIVGCIVFWKFIDGFCDKPLQDYMYARLIISLIVAALWLFDNQGKKK